MKAATLGYQMNDIRKEATRAFYNGAQEGDNPYDPDTQQPEYVEWHNAHWEAWREYKWRHKDWFGDTGGES